MELIVIIALIFGLPYLFVYFIDTLRGKTTLVKKHKTNKMNNSIKSKLNSGEKLTAEERKKIQEDLKLYELQYNLFLNDIKTKRNGDK